MRQRRKRRNRKWRNRKQYKMTQRPAGRADAARAIISALSHRTRELRRKTCRRRRSCRPVATPFQEALAEVARVFSAISSLQTSRKKLEPFPLCLEQGQPGIKSPFTPHDETGGPRNDDPKSQI